MFDKTMLRGLLALALVAAAVGARADTVNIDTVLVGNLGNAADTTMMIDGTTGYGSVPYVYRMGKYDVTAAEYCDFLNDVATTADTYGLYNVAMASTGSAGAYGCGIVQTSGSGGYSYSVLSGWGNMPVNYVTWGDAARFCNWLQNGQPVGPRG